MRYVLLFVETEQFAHDLEAMSQPDRDRAHELAAKWMADHTDKVRGGNQLQPAHTATTVRLDAGAEPVITDGPFVDGRSRGSLPDLTPGCSLSPATGDSMCCAAKPTTARSSPSCNGRHSPHP